MNSNDIRSSFINFFEKKNHKKYFSASLMPSSPNLLFTNAGMNQFVPYFLNEDVPNDIRIVNSQKCIRAGGKHNDLEDVGFDTYHHTFFEMLGNWSIGDYFKKDSIEWAWELLTKEWNFPKERLFVTVYKPKENEPSEFDKEAYKYWEEIFIREKLDPTLHIIFGAKKDNFWMMGETGPCGPCSEIHFDLTPKGDSNGELVNKDSPFCIEIWNLVFIQLNANDKGNFLELPNKHVDTGMGLERIAGIFSSTKGFKDFSQTNSNYNSDIFTKIFKKIENLSKVKYKGSTTKDHSCKSRQEEIDCAFRVISDHIRALCFSIADGIIPGNEGRNYVLRRILRRAIMYGQKLNLPKGFFSDLSNTVIEIFGKSYPELVEQKDVINKIILKEEDSFNKTLNKGLQLLDKISQKGSISGEEAFTLYDTYGFPFDLTNLIAKERNLIIDIKEFENCMKKQKEKARDSQKKQIISNNENYDLEKTNFIGYELDDKELKAKIISRIKLSKDEQAIVLDQTTFYGELGGQIGDTGTIINQQNKSYDVKDTIVKNGVFLHVINSLDNLNGNVTLKIDKFRRREIEKHHTATHLLNWALRKVFGSHIKQSGSSVEPNRLRFDFSHYDIIEEKDLIAIEQLVNQCIQENGIVEISEIKLKDKTEDTIAAFDEKYSDKVRVVNIGNYSKELCGGTHVKTTSEIGFFKITSETGIAAGTRRIEAVCGQSFLNLINKTLKTQDLISSKLKCNKDELLIKVDNILDANKSLERKLKAYSLEKINNLSKKLIDSKELNVKGIEIIKGIAPLDNSENLIELCKNISSKCKNELIILAAEFENKIQICCLASKAAVTQGFNAGHIIKDICKSLKGNGGGKDSFAMGAAPQNKNIHGIINNYKI